MARLLPVLVGWVAVITALTCIPQDVQMLLGLVVMALIFAVLFGLALASMVEDVIDWCEEDED